MSTITITFAEVVENHVGMEKIGAEIENGYSNEDILLFKKKFEKIGKKCELINLKIDSTADVYVLVVRQATKMPNKIMNELMRLEWDKKYYDTRRKKVLNKRARYNLCIADNAQEPDYENKKGRIVSWTDLTYLTMFRKKLMKVLIDDLDAEGNLYYDNNKCGIGWHGDAERKKVVGLRLGGEMNLCYQWHYKTKKIGKKYCLKLKKGDLYIMSEKATGNDWRRRNIMTLRHAAGSKYTK